MLHYQVPGMVEEADMKLVRPLSTRFTRWALHQEDVGKVEVGPYADWVKAARIPSRFTEGVDWETIS